MVMKLPLPTFPSAKMVDDLIAERQGGKNANSFNKIAVQWKTKVQEYINHGGSPEFIQPWNITSPAKKTLLNLYNSPAPGSVQGIMLKALRKHNLVLCPACGEAGKPNTLDHYLPKGTYPHFAVTPANLFPMCDACQGEKLEKTGDAANPRFFLHPYFDAFLDQTLFVLRIIPPFNTPSFSFSVNTSLQAAHQIIVLTHMRELGVERRFTHFAVGQHLRMLRLASGMRKTGQDIAAQVEAFRDLYAHPTKNSWEHIYFDAVVTDAALISHLRTGDLPDNI